MGKSQIVQLNSGALEIYSLCRRRIAEQSKELRLSIINWLQLSEGSGSDNLVQEL